MSQELKTIAVELQTARDTVGVLEEKLQTAVVTHITTRTNGQRDFARRIGMSPQVVCDIRHGRRKISKTVITRIIEYLTERKEIA